MKLSPPAEAEEDLATRAVVNDGNGNIVEEVELDSDEYASLADAVGNHAAQDGADRADKMDFEITDDEGSQPGDDGDSAVGGIKRKRTIRVVIRSRAFL